MGRRLAMIIATYEYQDSALRQLTAPAHDAEALATVLKDPAIAGYDVTTLINQPHHRVGEAIGDFYRDRRRDDLTLLYFSGHGLKDDDGRLYLAMANTRRDSLLFTALAAEQIDQAMEGCVSRQKVLILDCCYSGAFPAGRIPKTDTAVHTLERFQGRGRTVLTASDATQYSFEGNQAHGQAAQSVFTRYLVEGLREGSADLDGDGDIALDELYSYVHDRVVDEMPQQRPKKQDNVEGRIIIARNINWSLPAYLCNALNSPISTDRLTALDGLAHLHNIGNDLVRDRIIEEIRHLTDDDSKLVSAAATARLRALDPEPTRPPAAPTSVTTAEPSQQQVHPTAPAIPQVTGTPSAPHPGPTTSPEPSRVTPRTAESNPAALLTSVGSTLVQVPDQSPTDYLVPDQDFIKETLDQMGIKYSVDEEGDLVAPWEQFRTYFMFRGEDDQQVFSVRTFYDRPHQLDEKPQLLESIDDWNRRTLWPKVYTHVIDDEGAVRLIGETQTLISLGVKLDQFVSCVESWIRAAIEFDEWLVQALGLA
jgi:hypothetical protein